MTAQPWHRVSVPEAAVRLVARLEGLRTVPYQDSAGVWTIGYGTTQEPSGAPITAKTTPIGVAIAKAWLAHDLQSAAANVARLIDDEIALNETQASALISFVYNLGAGAFSRSTLRSYIRRGMITLAIAQFSVWRNVAGKPSIGIIRRRWAEAAVFAGADPDAACDRAWSEIQTFGDWPDPCSFQSSSSP